MPGNTPDLLATYWTIAGDVVPLGPPEREASALDFRTRVEAAHHAGYRGLGLIHSDLMNVSANTISPACARSWPTTTCVILNASF